MRVHKNNLIFFEDKEMENEFISILNENSNGCILNKCSDIHEYAVDYLSALDLDYYENGKSFPYGENCKLYYCIENRLYQLEMELDFDKYDEYLGIKSDIEVKLINENFDNNRDLEFDVKYTLTLSEEELSQFREFLNSTKIKFLRRVV